uniref:WD_REPEATS_REGION domain-containing protein n=1 Tax=Parascaris equorum TaxID=6256 RepID=A0A914S2W9_PAREQ
MFHFAAGSTEGTLPHPPGTQISKVQYGPDEASQLLAVSSWAGTVRIYHFPTTPVVGVERRVYAHTKAVLAFTVQLRMSEEHNLVASGGWDSTVKLWDIRTKGSAGFGNNGDKVYAMDTVGNRVVIGTKDRKIIVWDVRNLGEPEQIRDSPLKVLIYPVNCLAFHPVHNTFVTGELIVLSAFFVKQKVLERGDCICSDALVNIWDPFNRKRICQLHKFPASIMSVSFNPTGTQLAIAASSMSELKESPTTPPDSCVVIRRITDVEARPK